jgi:hypothetical protein
VRRDMRPDDSVTLTLGGVTHTFGPDRVTVNVDDSADRGNDRRWRFATIVIDLAAEFPEGASHIATEPGSSRV